MYHKYRKAIYLLRKHLFSIQVPDYGFIIDVEDLQTKLQKRHFSENWRLSYHYYGEDLNMRRTFYRPDQFESYQLHIRAIQRENGLEVFPHTELSPIQYPFLHMKHHRYSIAEGKRRFRKILSDLQ